MTASYLQDSVGDMVSAALAFAEGAQEACLLFLSEPGEHQVLLTRSGEMLHAEVRWYEDWASWGMYSLDDYETCLRTEITVIEFRAQVLALLDKLYSEYGEEEYQRRWIEHEFPTFQYRKLQRLMSREM